MALLVNGQYIDDNEIAAEAERMLPALREAMRGETAPAIEDRAREWARENVIERVILEQTARSDGEPIDPQSIEHALAGRNAVQPGCILPHLQPQIDGTVSMDRIRESTELRLRVERILRRVAEGQPAPSEMEVAEFYRQNLEQFTMPAMVHAAHIVKNVDESTSEREAYGQIERLADRLRKGESFETLADTESDCPGEGGDLGMIAPGQLVDPFEKVVFALAPGEISRSFRTVFGFHIAKAYRHCPSRVLPLEEVQQAIGEQLQRQAAGRAIEDYLDCLRAQARIEELAAPAMQKGMGWPRS